MLQFIFCLEISFGNVVVTVSKPLLEIYKFFLEASKFVTLVFTSLRALFDRYVFEIIFGCVPPF